MDITVQKLVTEEKTQGVGHYGCDHDYCQMRDKPQFELLLQTIQEADDEAEKNGEDIIPVVVHVEHVYMIKVPYLRRSDTSLYYPGFMANL